jgi:hypothetical protein
VSVERYKDDLIKHLIAVLMRSDPKRLKRVLKKHQLRDEDVSFHIQNSGRVHVEVRWPWERLDADKEPGNG